MLGAFCSRLAWGGGDRCRSIRILIRMPESAHRLWWAPLRFRFRRRCRSRRVSAAAAAAASSAKIAGISPFEMRLAFSITPARGLVKPRAGHRAWLANRHWLLTGLSAIPTCAGRPLGFFAGVRRSACNYRGRSLAGSSVARHCISTSISLAVCRCSCRSSSESGVPHGAQPLSTRSMALVELLTGGAEIYTGSTGFYVRHMHRPIKSPVIFLVTLHGIALLQMLIVSLHAQFADEGYWKRRSSARSTAFSQYASISSVVCWSSAGCRGPT